MSKKASLVWISVVVLVAGAAAWGGGRVLWHALLKMHGH